MKKTVALLGKCHLHLDQCPFDSGIEVWAMLNMLEHGLIPRADRLFDPHLPEIWGKHPNDPGYEPWLHEPHPFPIYMQKQYPDVPASVKYPLGAVLRRFFNAEAGEGCRANFYKGDNRLRHFFTSTFSYMIALALLEGYERVETYGIEMAVGSDYMLQRESAYFWFGIAHEMGVEIVIPKNSTLFGNSPTGQILYGYNYF